MESVLAVLRVVIFVLTRPHVLHVPLSTIWLAGDVSPVRQAVRHAPFLQDILAQAVPTSSTSVHLTASPAHYLVFCVAGTPPV